MKPRHFLIIAGLVAAGGAPAHAAIGAAPLFYLECSALGPLVEAFLVRHIDPLALAPLEYPPFEVAVAPPDSGPGAQTADRRLEYPPGTQGGPAPRKRPTTQTAEVVPSAAKGKVPDTILAAIQAYQRFRTGVLAMAKMRLNEPDSIRQSQKILAGANQVALARGWLATCSQIATKAGDFIAGLTSAASKEASGADGLKSRLEQKPGDIWQVPGSQNASSAVLKQVASDSAIMQSVAQRLIEVGYGRTKAEPQRAADAAKGNYGATPAAPPSEPVAKAKPLVAQILALGARMQLAQSGPPPDSQGASNIENDQCLRWAQLNLSQCLAAVHDNSERAFCLGRHGIEERVKCWSWIAEGG
jgi:hypothetical protein